MITKELLSADKQSAYEETLIRYGLTEEWGQEALQKRPKEDWEAQGFGLFAIKSFQDEVNRMIKIKKEREDLELITCSWRLVNKNYGGYSMKMGINDEKGYILVNKEDWERLYIMFQTPKPSGEPQIMPIKIKDNCYLMANGKRVKVVEEEITELYLRDRG